MKSLCCYICAKYGAGLKSSFIVIMFCLRVSPVWEFPSRVLTCSASTMMSRHSHAEIINRQNISHLDVLLILSFNSALRVSLPNLRSESPLVSIIVTLWIAFIWNDIQVIMTVLKTAEDIFLYRRIVYYLNIYTKSKHENNEEQRDYLHFFTKCFYTKH